MSHAQELDPAAASAIEALARALERDGDVLFVTGAGLSADSGLPTYRGQNGLYEGRDAESGLTIEEALSLPVFQRRPDISWRHIRTIAQGAQGARPNRGHVVIASLARHLPRVVVLTQNVDGLHEAAGTRDVINIHGDIQNLVCTACGWSQPTPDVRRLPDVPRCPECRSVLRLPVVLFGEPLPSLAVSRLQAELEQGFSTVVQIGTSSRFPYIVAPIRVVQSAGGIAAEINPEPTSMSPWVDIRIRAGAARALDYLGSLLGIG